MCEMSEKSCLFVQLPTGETASLKRLDISTSGSQIIAKLELSAGIPADIFNLHYLGLQVENTTLLNFGDNIYSGAILRLKIKEEFKSLHAELSRGSGVLTSIIDNYSAYQFNENPNKHAETTVRNHHSSDIDGLLPKSSTDKTTFDNRMFVSLFVAASKGNSKLCSKILQRVPRTIHMVTSFGRGALHAAAAFDQVLVVSLLLNTGFSPTTVDWFGRSPLHVASDYNSYTCHRLLKVAQRKQWAAKCKPGFCDTKMQETTNYLKSKGDSAFTPRIHLSADVDFRSLIQKSGLTPETLKQKPSQPSRKQSSVRQSSGSINERKCGKEETDSKKRSKSAPYCETKYHVMAKQQHVYRGRPATADSRFRFWKTWLVEKIEADGKEPEEIKQKKAQKRYQNEAAFKLWLKRKYLEERTENRSSAQDTTESDSDSVENDADDYVNTFYARHWPAMDNKTAFSQWVELKKREERQHRQSTRVRTPKIHHKEHASDRRITCFEMGNTDDGVVTQQSSDRYIGCYGRWVERKKKYVACKERNGDEMDTKRYSRKEIEEQRRVLLQQGMTYEEWLGLKENESRQSTPSGTKGSD